MRDKYVAVIGLEVHAQLLTKTKAFCSCINEYGGLPNTQTCPVCLGMPGSLPVLNKMLVEYSIMMGLATNCKIRKHSRFSRKNYFYQDLPKGYQITQYDDPICYDGYVEIEKEEGLKRIRVNRIHIEEDTGKSNHDLDIDTLVDLNRAGVPLIEIVTEPDIASAEEAYKYLNQIKNSLIYLNICSGNMEEGALRCDANISVMLKGADKYGTRAEVKNMNSFRNVEKAIEYEVNRQIEIIENGGSVVQETRMWDGAKNITKSMRSKEMAHDYRYFPEPDLLGIEVSDEWKESLKSKLPELPLAKKIRFETHYGLNKRDAGILTEDISIAKYFELACSVLTIKNEKRYKLISNWIQSDVMRLMSEKSVNIVELNLNPKIISQLSDLSDDGVISNKIAKEIFIEAISSGKLPNDIVNEKGLKQLSDTTLIEEIVVRVIASNPETLEKYKSGKTNFMGFFVGQVLKETKGQANPQIVSDLVKKHLES
jgi:aspartyl-tRNA(Asn)/glutamyl-tRNA(Gln) amidotransferase subunit B